MHPDLDPQPHSLLRDIIYGLDPVRMAQGIGIDPDPWQAEVLQDTESRKRLLLCCRQSGKSTITAMVAVHQAVYIAPSLVLLISPSQRQSGELFRKCRTFWSQLPDAPAALNENQSTLDLSNGSRIISLPGSEATTRGYSAADLVIVDEASRVTDELVAAIRPSLATTNGRMIALSTPYGRQGWFYKAWSEGQGWERTKVTAYDCGRISKEFLEGERAELGEWMFAQEYGCEFTDTDTQFFASEIIERALTDDVEPLFAS